jgi:heme-degrading monooxygenase HmoA
MNDGIFNCVVLVVTSIYLNSLFQALTEKGKPMTVKIIIKRRVSDVQSAQLTPFLKKLRNLAMNQPGYITGETLKRIDPPGQNLVISTWESIEAWQQWVANPERVPVQANIDVLIGVPTTYEIYSSE